MHNSLIFVAFGTSVRTDKQFLRYQEIAAFFLLLWKSLALLKLTFEFYKANKTNLNLQ